MTEAELDAFTQRVAAHINATIGEQGQMLCPACGGDFGPTRPVGELALLYADDDLPGAPLLVGACLDCGHVTSPDRVRRMASTRHHLTPAARQLLQSLAEQGTGGAVTFQRVYRDRWVIEGRHHGTQVGELTFKQLLRNGLIDRMPEAHQAVHLTPEGRAAAAAIPGKATR